MQSSAACTDLSNPFLVNNSSGRDLPFTERVVVGSLWHSRQSLFSNFSAAAGFGVTGAGAGGWAAASGFGVAGAGAAGWATASGFGVATAAGAAGAAAAGARGAGAAPAGAAGVSAAPLGAASSAADAASRGRRAEVRMAKSARARWVERRGFKGAGVRCFATAGG
jgi:hypothetical protein